MEIWHFRAAAKPEKIDKLLKKLGEKHQFHERFIDRFPKKHEKVKKLRFSNFQKMTTL